MASIRNRQFWNASSDAYQAEHGASLEDLALAWGVWRIPETDLDILGVVEGRDILELGCGAAQWTRALAAIGARAVGVDMSERQLAHAQVLARRSDTKVALVHGNAEQLPFRRHAFDIVFCDHGAMLFGRPALTVAEAARVLRPGGVLAFCMSTPIRHVCVDADGTVTPRLATDYFTLSAFDDGESVEYQLPYGDWIRLFRRHGLVVDDLVELRPPADATTTYAGYVPLEWARRWPAEHVWKVRKV
jgi:SAM-dependent methyltransferase